MLFLCFQVSLIAFFSVFMLLTIEKVSFSLCKVQLKTAYTELY